MKRHEFDALRIGDKVYRNKGLDKGKACTVVDIFPYGDVTVIPDHGVVFEEAKWKGQQRRYGSYRYFDVGKYGLQEAHLVVCYDRMHELIDTDVFWDAAKALTCFNEKYPSPNIYEDSFTERNVTRDGNYSYYKAVGHLDVFIKTVKIR